MQSGMLFHTQLAGSSFDAYHMQLVFQLSGDVDPDRMHRAAQAPCWTGTQACAPPSSTGRTAASSRWCPTP
ncbi:hypothetical protein [Streptomyces sp. KL116D]|uniref:hypothetical protein n=1 Tax=Streptomyces sp. KL116D TaxID=3045152 RepID=UPI00355763D3